MYSYEDINLQYSTQLEVLTLSRCTESIIQRNGLAIIDQVTSSHFRELNISILSHEMHIDSLLAETRPHLSAVDVCLQHANFANLERLLIGLPSGVVNPLHKFFPLTAARNLVRVTSIGEMMELPIFTMGRMNEASMLQ